MIPERTKQLERQSDQLEIIAKYFTDEAESKRATKKARAMGLIVSAAIFVATIWPVLFEGTLYVIGQMENREAAERYANVARGIYYNENNPEIALTFIKKSMDLDPDNSDYRYLESYINGMAVVRKLLNLDRPFNKQEVDEAHQSMANAELLKLLHPEKAESFILKGQIYSALGENKRSLSELEEAIKMEPRNDFAHVRLALIRYNLKEFEKSLEELDTALQINPKSKWAFLWKGIIIGEWKKDWVTANSFYQEALNIDPRFDIAYYNLGWSYLKSSPKNYKSAQQSFEKALKINPNYKEALYGLAMVYGYQDRYEISALYLTKAKDLDNNFLTAWKWLGIVNNEMGNFKEALFAFDKAISLNPSDSKLYVRRAKLFSKKENYKKGINDLRLAAEMDPGNKRIWFYLGDIMGKLENPRGAIDYFDKATDIQPKYSEAYLGKAKAFAKLKDDKNAEENFQKSLEMSKNKKERVFYEKGIFEKSRGNLIQARKDFQEARKFNKNFADAWLAEANILVDLNKKKDAIALLEEYLKLRPEDNRAREIISKVKI